MYELRTIKVRNLSQEWKLFSDIFINENDEIESPFLHFSIGTDRLEIWHWFDDNDIYGIVHLMGLKDQSCGTSLEV